MSLGPVQSVGMSLVRFGVLPILAAAIGLALVSCSPSQPQKAKAPQEENTAEESAASPTVAEQPAAPETAAEPQADLESRARGVVNHLVAGEFAQVTADFDTKMTTALPVSALQGTWNETTDMIGAFKSIDTVTRSTKDAYQVVVVTCLFENAKADVKIIYDQAGKIAGLWILPAGK